jgi:hypothetical protein
MLTSLAVLVLAVSPGKMALFSVDGQGLTNEQRATWADRVKQALADKHYDVLTTDAMPPGLAGQAGSCGADLRCLGAVAEAVGAESVLVAVVSRAGDRNRLELRVQSTGDGMVLASARAEGGALGEVASAVDAAVTALVVQFEASAPPPEPPARKPGLGLRFWVPVISGVAVMAAGGFVFGTALVDLDATRKAQGVTLTDEEAGARITAGIAQRNLGIAGMSLGAASILSGVIWGTVPADASPISVGAFLGPSSGGLRVTGSF